jgi:hypothetical protein
MNKRIRDLSEEANRRCSDKPYDEILTELIVAEFDKLCDQAIMENQESLSKLDLRDWDSKLVARGAIAQAQKLKDSIKQYFGEEK